MTKPVYTNWINITAKSAYNKEDIKLKDIWNKGGMKKTFRNEILLLVTTFFFVVYWFVLLKITCPPQFWVPISPELQSRSLFKHDVTFHLTADTDNYKACDKKQNHNFSLL